MIGKSKRDFLGFAKFAVEKLSQRALDQTMTAEVKERNARLHGQNWAPNRPLTDDNVSVELAAAQKGVLGMMHFANFDSPLLLEALGDLLVASTPRQDDALQLAARAYYRIVQLSDNEETKEQFKKAARNAVTGHLDYIQFRGDWGKDATGPHRDELEKLSADLDRELLDAQTYFAIIADDEQRWIADGRNVDKAFAAKYYDSLESTIEAAEQKLSQEPRDVRGNPYQETAQRGLLIWAVVLLAIISISAGGVSVYRRFRRKH
jgi:hypothetical protein